MVQSFPAQKRLRSPTGVILGLIQEKAKKVIRVRTDILIVTINLEVQWEIVERLITRKDLRYAIIILKGSQRYNIPHYILIAGSRETLMREWERRKFALRRKEYDIFRPRSNSFENS